MTDKDNILALAALTLHHARTNQWEKAGDTVGELETRHGFTGITGLILALADTIIHAQSNYDSSRPRSIVIPLWVDEHGNVNNADDVPPPVRWAGQLVAARAAKDTETFTALIVNSIASKDECENVFALLDMCATTLNLLERSTP